MLCTTCRQIFSGFFSQRTSAHHIYLQKLEQAALDNCYICQVLWRTASDQPPRLSGKFENPKSKPISKYCFSRKSADGSEILELEFVVDRNGVEDGGSCVVFCLQSMNDADSIDVNVSSSAHTWESSVQNASKWLSECLDGHDRCRMSPLSGYTPTRLIQIGSPSADKIRLLLHPSEQGIVLRYATLSHCWGASQASEFSSLTSASRDVLEEGVSISDLDPVFQDAIYTARSLGLHFLWMDSLCIFQDSIADWHKEAPLMSHVYGGAVLNIAASVAEKNEASCFPERDLSLIQPCVIEPSWDNFENDVYNIYYTGFWDDTFESLPLMERAWVTQELLLAPRVLHLTGSQLFWECYELNACEAYPGGLPPNLPERWMMRDTLWTILHSARRGPESRVMTAVPEIRDAMRESWANIVEVYTACQLTYQSDKLMALSGFSRVMERALHDKYCAGLWRSTLITDLFWLGPCNGLELCPRPSPYRAPSWSWASLDGRVSLPSAYNEHCEVQTATQDPFGAVTGGLLRLSGSLTTIELRSRTDGGWLVFFDGTWWKDGGDQLHCLPLYLDTHQSPEWNKTSGQFRRVGVLNAFSKALGMDVWTKFEDQKKASWFEYESMSKDGRYEISIL
ncbi:HET domain-containing protein [Aspergillus candidus]|uniref:Heterokaryon incompatibility protein-domain-containing protein n=1 Tax=Aspergillus candidus TaxID=41067 RepID=A0A2I2FBX8_ASPCN|nr:heterokaryon incompatibility protein-domain-containing protein [Aspergillus candidus]PLB38136.1 heterokaryon incompatibility protein-domain-containing protein [Aspergillus candidus]